MKRIMKDYSHRKPQLDKLLGMKLSITMPEGKYIGILEYDQGWYFMLNPVFKTDKGQKTIPIWKCRKKYIPLRGIKILGDKHEFS